MPTPRKAGRFGGSAAHHKHIVANLATELLRHGRIRTTHAKAKTVQPTAERLITFAKRGDLHSRRQARKIVRDRDVLHHLFAEVGPAFADRDGGYTRVLKLGPRKGDAAPMALVELVADVAGGPGADAGDEPRRRWSLRRGRAPEAAAPAAEGEGRVASLDDSTADEGAERPEVDPAEVEARFAAEEAEEADAGRDDEAAAADHDEAAATAGDEAAEDEADEDGDRDRS